MLETRVEAAIWETVWAVCVGIRLHPPPPTCVIEVGGCCMLPGDWPSGTFVWELLQPPSQGSCKSQTFYCDCSRLCKLLGVGSDPFGSNVPPRAWCLFSRARSCKHTVLELTGPLVALELLLLWRRSVFTRRGGRWWRVLKEAEVVENPGCIQVLTVCFWDLSAFLPFLQFHFHCSYFLGFLTQKPSSPSPSLPPPPISSLILSLVTKGAFLPYP